MQREQISHLPLTNVPALLQTPRNPMHGAVHWLGRYLLHSKRKGIRFRADITRGLEVFVNASFAGNLDKQDAQTGDRNIARPRHGYIILYYG